MICFEMFSDDTSNTQIIEMIEDFNEKGNEPLLSRIIHERYYEILLERGLFDNFFIQCTSHIATQIQVITQTICRIKGEAAKKKYSGSIHGVITKPYAGLRGKQQ